MAALTFTMSLIPTLQQVEALDPTRLDVKYSIHMRAGRLAGVPKRAQIVTLWFMAPKSWDNTNARDNLAHI